MCGVGKTTVRKWELGLTENMKVDKIKRLSKALKISPLELLGHDNDPYTLDYLKQINKNISETYNDKNPYNKTINTITSNLSKLDLEELLFIDQLINKMMR